MISKLREAPTSLEHWRRHSQSSGPSSIRIIYNLFSYYPTDSMGAINKQDCCSTLLQRQASIPMPGSKKAAWKPLTLNLKRYSGKELPHSPYTLLDMEKIMTLN